MSSAAIPVTLKPRTIELIGTYVPRRCGIATFSADLVRALRSVSNTKVGVIALNDMSSGYDYPDEVDFEINQNRLADYRIAADYLNANQVDAVSVQHEYGIYGGTDGSHILKLMARLSMPVVTTLHTVLQEPTVSQKRVIVELAELSDRLVVMSEIGKRFMTEGYGIDPERIAVAPHGIPDMPFVDPNYYKDQFGVEGKKVILTFGLLSPNKGIETMIRALPGIAERHPDSVFMVLGATHPHVRKASGESYRLGLQQLAGKLNVDDRVIFYDRYVDSNELAAFLGAADLYVTPYLNRDQIVSGTLAYAMGAGKAVISTPYWYAAEMLDDGRGRLVPFENPEELARAVIELLDDDVERHAMRKRAYTFSRGRVWSKIAVSYLELFVEALRERTRLPRVLPAATDRGRGGVAAIPEINLAQIKRLTDSTGILQHANYHVPNREHGYCTDDNARALIAVVRARPHIAEVTELDELAIRYLGFLDHAFNPELGVFRNFMSYDRRWLEQRGSNDSHGRAIWALGVASARLEDEHLRMLAARLLHRALPGIEGTHHLRTIAYASLGLRSYLSRYSGDSLAKRAFQSLAERLWAPFQQHADKAWPWPEDVLTYANARVVHALLESGERLANREMIDQALTSLEWLFEVQTLDGHFCPIGNQGFYRRKGPRARFDQQPVEADGAVAACASAFRISRDRVWLERAILPFLWFLGQNDIGVSLYDDATGGCRDGLQPTGANENQVAESTLAWLNALAQVHVWQAAGELGWTRTPMLARRGTNVAEPVIYPHQISAELRQLH